MKNVEMKGCFTRKEFSDIVWKWKNFAKEGRFVRTKLSKEQFFELKHKFNAVEIFFDSETCFDGNTKIVDYAFKFGDIVIIVTHITSCHIGNCWHSYFISHIFPSFFNKFAKQIAEVLLSNNFNKIIDLGAEIAKKLDLHFWVNYENKRVDITEKSDCLTELFITENGIFIVNDDLFND